VETVRILLEAGADPNVRAGLPLTLVAKHGQRLTGLLLEHGADPKINGGEALMLAADVANYEVVSLLLSRGPLSKKSDALLSAQIQLHAINQALMANNPQLYIGPLEGMVSRHASPRDALLLIKFRLEKTIEALTSPHYSNDHLY
jgi:ankyrin repeat protein